MNIFVLHEVPSVAARYMCDKHIPKMCVESAQMMASALRRHGAEDKEMPLTQGGRAYKGGYHHHPCTKWVGDSQANYQWLMWHAVELCREFHKRYDKIHACTLPIFHMCGMSERIPSLLSRRTEFVQAMPDEYKDECAVKAYRRYYIHEKKGFATWNKGTPTPLWWITQNQIKNEQRQAQAIEK